jgi:glutamate-1-semialdehyde 2,1-aminomutase
VRLNDIEEVTSMLKSDRTEALFAEAKKYTPGGVNTSIRAVDRPLVFARASGSKTYDADGNEYIDYHAAFGPPLLGHCNRRVNQRVFEVLEKIDLIGVGTTELEARVAEKIVEHVPSAEMALMCNTGSEATHHAIRLSRAVTGRRKIIKFQGCYHGWHDYVCMNVITPADRVGKKDPCSAGMLQEAVDNTLVVTFNSLEEVEAVVGENHGEIAAIILEPIPHNIGCVLPQQEFLEGLREICDKEGIILIFDEVITGFRHNLGGYQKICGVTPDLTALGKAIANGYPCAAICGKKELMERFATGGGDVFFAGTYNAHPLSMAAALETIEQLEDGTVHEHIFDLGSALREGLKELVARYRVKAHVTGFGSVFVVYFMDPPVNSYTDLLRNDSERDMAFRWGMVDRGIFMHPMCLKRSHVSAAHTEEDVGRTLEKAAEVLKEIA